MVAQSGKPATIFIRESFHSLLRNLLPQNTWKSNSVTVIKVTPKIKTLKLYIEIDMNGHMDIITDVQIKLHH